MRRSLFAVLIISVLSAACATLDGTPKPALSPPAPRAEGASALQEVSFTGLQFPRKNSHLGQRDGDRSAGTAHAGSDVAPR